MLKYQPKESSTVKEHFVNKIIKKSHQRWPSKGMTGSSNNFQTSIWDDCQIKYFFKSQLDSVFVLSFVFFSYFTLRFAPDPGWLHTLTRTKPGWQTSNLEIDWRVVCLNHSFWFRIFVGQLEAYLCCDFKIFWGWSKIGRHPSKSGLLGRYVEVVDAFKSAEWAVSHTSTELGQEGHTGCLGWGDTPLGQNTWNNGTTLKR